MRHVLCVRKTDTRKGSKPIIWGMVKHKKPRRKHTGPFRIVHEDQDIVVVTASDGESTATHTWTVARMLNGDFDGSGAVDFTDFLTFAAVFGQTVESGVDPIIDIDGSGVIDFADFLIFASFFGVTI